VTLGIVAVSVLISAGYLVAAFVKNSNELKLNGLIMLLTGPAGILYYLGEFVLSKIFTKEYDVDFSEFAISRNRAESNSLPDTAREMQIVPLEEVLLTSTDEEKRKRLLYELKKDYIGNFKTIKKAFDDKDSETSHYAAAAVSSIRGEYEANLRRLDTRYSQATNEQKLLLTREYSDYLLEFMNSSILDEYEMLKYSQLYVGLMSAVNDEQFFTEADYEKIVDCAILSDNLPRAEKFALKSFGILPSEKSYMNLLKVYYYTNRSELFLSTLNELKKSDNSLSNEGLALVRFFMKDSDR
jgi:hypothetical protein